MVHPSVPCMIVTPICPHSLSFRSIVVPSGVELEVSTYYIYLDLRIIVTKGKLCRTITFFNDSTIYYYMYITTLFTDLVWCNLSFSMVHCNLSFSMHEPSICT